MEQQRLRYAWAASDLIGINALIELGYGEAVDRRMDNALYHKYGISADLDILRKVRALNRFRDRCGL